MSTIINTRSIDINHFLYQIKDTFGLNEYPFNNIDNELIILAFIPNCKNNKRVPSEIIENIKSKYNNCNHQLLEFYGDKILNSVITYIVSEIFNFDISVPVASNLVSYIISNRLLTDVMLDIDMCKYVLSENYPLERKGKFHNSCADSFEALIGVLFYHLKNLKLPIMESIKTWIMKNTKIPYIIKEFLSRTKYDADVYIINNRAKLLKEWIRKNGPHANINLFPERALIVTEDTTLKHIFTALKWNYSAIIFRNGLFSIRLIKGYTPVDIITNNFNELDIKVRELLLEQGFIVNLLPFNATYSKEIFSHLINFKIIES